MYRTVGFRVKYVYTRCHLHNKSTQKAEESIWCLKALCSMKRSRTEAKEEKEETTSSRQPSLGERWTARFKASAIRLADDIAAFVATRMERFLSDPDLMNMVPSAAAMKLPDDIMRRMAINAQLPITKRDDLELPYEADTHLKAVVFDHLLKQHGISIANFDDGQFCVTFRELAPDVKEFTRRNW